MRQHHGDAGRASAPAAVTEKEELDEVVVGRATPIIDTSNGQPSASGTSWGVQKMRWEKQKELVKCRTSCCARTKQWMTPARRKRQHAIWQKLMVEAEALAGGAPLYVHWITAAAARRVDQKNVAVANAVEHNDADLSVLER